MRRRTSLGWSFSHNHNKWETSILPLASAANYKHCTHHETVRGLDDAMNKTDTRLVDMYTRKEAMVHLPLHNVSTERAPAAACQQVRSIKVFAPFLPWSHDHYHHSRRLMYHNRDVFAG